MKLPRTFYEFKEYSRRLVACAVSALIALTPAISFALPQGGVVVGGTASIADGVGRVDVNQISDKAVIDWRGFDLKEGETTQFHQPNANSLTVNRVNSDSPSIINGKLSANGNVMVINPNGMLFGGKANVDVNGLIASTADGDNSGLMKSGTLNLGKPGKPDAAIINQGHIKTKDGGRVGILAPNISNQGVIEARLGKVQLASGDTAAVDFYGDGLINAAVSDKVTSQLVENSGIISAEGGSIAITAAAGDQIVDSLINLGGVLDARSVGNKPGKITVQADGSNAIRGNRASDKGKKSGSSSVLVSGIIDASGRGAGERGGFIQVLGDNIALLAGALLDASGYSGKSGTTNGKDKSAVRDGSAGGDIKIGGDYLGQGETPTAKNLYVDPGAFILNDAIQSGDAGRNIFWSDGTTQFYGNVFARALGGKTADANTLSAIAGGNAGDGGFVETSGHGHLDAGGYVDLTASNGNRGTYFLDPADITIYGNVDPAFVSTDGTINLNANLKLWLDASDTAKVNLTYNSLGTTATGTSGTNTITVSANTGLVVGSRIRLGAAGAVTAASTVGADTYTVTNIAGTTITLASNLTTGYAASGVFQGYVSQLSDKSTAGNNASQGVASSMPLWVSNGQNGIGVAQLNGTSDYLRTVFDNFPMNADYSVGVVVTQTDASTVGNIVGTGFGGGYSFDFGGSTFVKLFNGGSGSNFATSSTPLPLSQAGIVNATYVSGSRLGTIYQNSSNVGSGVATTANNQGATYIGAYNGSFYFTGNIDEVLLYNSTLLTNQRNLVEQYQSAKWNIALDPVAGAGTEVAEATGATGYSVFSTRYLERLSQTADISLQATNNITLDLKTDTLALANNRDLTLTAGNDILSTSNGTITTAGVGRIFFTALHDVSLSNNVTLNALGSGLVRLEAGNSIIESSGGSVTTNGGNILLNSDRDNSGAGAISLGVGTALTSSGGNITLGGGNGAIGGVVLNADGTVNTAAVGFARGDSTYIDGILNSGTITSGSGNVIMNGREDSAVAAGAFYHGVRSGTINTTSGTVQISGIGGGAGTSVNNFGVRADPITTVDGNIAIYGIGGAPGAGGGGNFGVYVTGPVRATGTGAINITGQGGASPTVYNAGVALAGRAQTNSGAIVINGTGGTGNFGGGIYSQSFSGTIATSVSGNITVTGTGNPVWTQPGITFANGGLITSTGSSSIVLNASGFGGTSDILVNPGYTTTIGGAAATGNLALNANTLAWDIGATLQTTGNVLLKPRTNTTIGVGTGAGTLNISNILLGNIIAGSITIGDTVNTGAMDINTSAAFAEALNFFTKTGSNITLSGALASSATGNAIVLASGQNFINNAGASGLSTPSGRWLVYSANPASDMIGGLNAAFTHYSSTYGSYSPGTVTESGKGFIYSVAGINTPGAAPSGGGGAQLPVLDTTGPNSPITSIPVVPVAFTPPQVAPAATPALNPVTLPITVERISIDPTPIIMAFAFEVTGVSQAFENALNDVPSSEDAASHATVSEAGNDSEAPQASIQSDNRALSVWDGMLTFSPELVRRLGLDERSLD